MIFVHAFHELLTVRGGNQKSAVIQASPMGGGRGVLAKGAEPPGDCLALAWLYKGMLPV